MLFRLSASWSSSFARCRICRWTRSRWRSCLVVINGYYQISLLHVLNQASFQILYKLFICQSHLYFHILIPLCLTHRDIFLSLSSSISSNHFTLWSSFGLINSNILSNFCLFFGCFLYNKIFLTLSLCLKNTLFGNFCLFNSLLIGIREVHRT